MAKIPVEVTFETITPLWTGDAWGENEEIKTSSILGALRFWFAFYWKTFKNGYTESLNPDGVPNEVLTELENPLEGKTFKKLFKKYLLEDELEYDEAIDKALETLKLSVPSRIFGCTGWKGRLQLNIVNDSIKIKKISFSEIDTNYLINSEFWIKKVLFQDGENIKVFEGFKIILKVPKYWWDKYLKGFIEFLEDKVILIGGKKSFGFGFVKVSNIKVDSNQNSFISKSFENFLVTRQIPIPYKNKKEVLGYNFRYFLRKNTKKQFRENNFGKQGKASKVYISNLLKNIDETPYVILLVLNSPFKDKQDKIIPPQVIDFYEKLLGSKNEKS